MRGAAGGARSAYPRMVFFSFSVCAMTESVAHSVRSPRQSFQRLALVLASNRGLYGSEPMPPERDPSLPLEVDLMNHFLASHPLIAAENVSCHFNTPSHNLNQFCVPDYASGITLEAHPSCMPGKLLCHLQPQPLANAMPQVFKNSRILTVVVVENLLWIRTCSSSFPQPAIRTADGT
jgi:hypothetical protein